MESPSVQVDNGQREFGYLEYRLAVQTASPLEPYLQKTSPDIGFEVINLYCYGADHNQQVTLIFKLETPSRILSISRMPYLVTLAKEGASGGK
ncbi:hypothetical protein CEXT_516221 [Caerostris extrusa]|uniref:Uncharacterized protein n=1 Tax=Caerostris extrusa TaxID=172846 RepID=A0AAV4N8V8_CAEEX|nr:hypothetical protein CEXT_516221 [Caerostris extrusa]